MIPLAPAFSAHAASLMVSLLYGHSQVLLPSDYLLPLRISIFFSVMSGVVPATPSMSTICLRTTINDPDFLLIVHYPPICSVGHH
jgi:hypothetical protein